MRILIAKTAWGATTAKPHPNQYLKVYDPNAPELDRGETRLLLSGCDVYVCGHAGDHTDMECFDAGVAFGLGKRYFDLADPHSPTLQTILDRLSEGSL